MAASSPDSTQAKVPVNAYIPWSVSVSSENLSDVCGIVF